MREGKRKRILTDYISGFDDLENRILRTPVDPGWKDES